MLLIVLGTMLLMYGTFHAIAVEQRAFRWGTKLALFGIVLMIYGRNIEAAHRAPKLCLPDAVKSEQARYIPAVCKIEY